MPTATTLLTALIFVLAVFIPAGIFEVLIVNPRVLRRIPENVRERFFGGNAVYGHILFLADGVTVFIMDVVFGLKPEMTILTVAPAISVFAALLLPYHGYDRRKEVAQANILTFGPSLVIGCIFGGGASSLVMDFGIVAEWRSSLGLPDVAAATSTLTPSIATAYIAATIVFIAYITVGYMSRDKRFEAFVFLDAPHAVKKLVMMLYAQREHILIDTFIKAFLAMDERLWWGFTPTMVRTPKGTLVIIAPEGKPEDNPRVILEEMLALSGRPDLREPVVEELRAWLFVHTATTGAETLTRKKPWRGVSGAIRK